MRETPQEYLARKRAKGTLGLEKPYTHNGKPVLTGYCPCDCHPGEPMIVCDPVYNDCQCCDEVCS